MHLRCLGAWLVAAVALCCHGATPGEDLFSQKRYPEAQAWFETALNENPENATAHHYLGRLARLRGELELAVEYLEQAVALAPEDAAVQYDYGAAASLYADTLGISFRAAGFARRGREALEKAVALAPENAQYRAALIEFYTTAPSIVGGSLAKAHEQAEALRAIDPVQGALTAGRLYLRQEQFSEARREFARALELSPENPLALFRIGELAARTGEELPAGEAALERALALAGEPSPFVLAQAHWRLGQIRARRDNLEGARTALRAALALDPMNEDMAADLARLSASTPSTP